MDVQYLQNKLIKIATAILSIGAVLYALYSFFYGLTVKMETEPARITALTETVETVGYIFRDEITLSSSSSGSRIPVVSDGARVGVGDVLSRQYDKNAPDTVARIEGLQTQLDVIEQMRRQKMSVRDAASVESEIYDILEDISALSITGECGSALSLRSSLSAAMNRRYLLTGSSAELESVYSSLLAEKNAQLAKLGTCRSEQTSPYSGYYYAECDGYEKLFTADKASSMTAAEFDALTQTEASTGTTAGKIAPDSVWYTACRIPADKAGAFTPGKEYTAQFPYNEGKTLTMHLIRTDTDEDGTLLVFSCDALPAGFRFTRAQTIVIGTRDYEGIRLPLSALRLSDGVTGVYIQEGGFVRFRAVEILFEEEDYFLVDPAPEKDPPENMQWLERNDIVITQGKRLYDGRILA